MALIYGELVRAQLQNSASDLTPTATGLIYFNTTTGPKWYNGTTWKTAADLDSSQTLSSKTLGNTNVVTLRDDRFTLQDDSDNTKQAVFQLSGISTGTTRTFTFPDSSGTILTNATATFSDSSFTLQDNVDATKQLLFQLSGISTGTTRTLTVPNASDTLAVLGTAQTFSAVQTFSAQVDCGSVSDSGVSQLAVNGAGENKGIHVRNGNGHFFIGNFSGTGAPFIAQGARHSATSNTLKYQENSTAAMIHFDSPNGSAFKFQGAPSGTAGNDITWTDLGVVSTSAQWTLGNTSNTGSSLFVSNSSTANPAAIIRNHSTSTSADTVAAMEIIKGSTTATTSQVFLRNYINAGGTGAGGLRHDGGTGTAVFSTSDRALKEDIADYAGGLQAIMALKPSTFRLKASPDKVHTGFIAQDVEAVLPHLVALDGNMRSLLGMNGIVPYLVSAIQELKREIDVLKGGN